MPISIANLKTQFVQHRLKSGILGTLTLVMVIVGLRTILEMSPSPAAASMALSPAASHLPVADTPEAADRVRQSKLLWETLRERRGIAPDQTFTFDSTYYTLDPSRKRELPEPISKNEQTPEKSPPKTADVSVASRRAALIQEEAGKLMLQTTVMGQVPIAVINGQVLRVGEQLNDFRVVSIQARQVIVKKDGETVALKMAH